METIVKKGDRVRMFTTPAGYQFGTVVEAKISYGTTCATIKPDGEDDLSYLNHGAIEGFDLLEENHHPWSPISMARMRLYKFCPGMWGK